MKHLELLITFIELGCDVELFFFWGGGGGMYITYVGKVRLYLPVCAGILAAPCLCHCPGEASGVHVSLSAHRASVSGLIQRS